MYAINLLLFDVMIHTSLQVRRSHLINDTLLQMSLRKEDLKKPLKVQFMGEEGIDEGGVQKEFFQLIMSQARHVSFEQPSSNYLTTI